MEFNNKDIEIEKQFDSSRRIVLIEKSPFLMVLKCNIASNVGFKEKTVNGLCVGLSFGRKFLIRPVTKIEWGNSLLNSFGEKTYNIHFKRYLRKKYYIIIDCEETYNTLDEKLYPFIAIGSWVVEECFDIILDKNGNNIYSL